MSDEEKGFVIKDKRHFSQESGDQAETKSETDNRADRRAEKEAEAGIKPEKTAGSTKSGPGAEAGGMPLPEIKFSTIVFSLSSSALLHLGEIPDPVTNQLERNLSLAKQTIDILGMLKTKTEGNLDQEEADLLKNLLYELRMKYITAVKG